MTDPIVKIINVTFSIYSVWSTIKKAERHTELRKILSLIFRNFKSSTDTRPHNGS